MRGVRPSLGAQPDFLLSSAVDAMRQSLNSIRFEEIEQSLWNTSKQLLMPLWQFTNVWCYCDWTESCSWCGATIWSCSLIPMRNTGATNGILFVCCHYCWTEAWLVDWTSSLDLDGLDNVGLYSIASEMLLTQKIGAVSLQNYAGTNGILLFLGRRDRMVFLVVWLPDSLTGCCESKQSDDWILESGFKWRTTVNRNLPSWMQSL